MAGSVEHAPLAPFGVEVHLGFEEALDPSVQEQLRTLFQTDGLILFRGLKLTMEDQIRLCRVFGPALPMGHVENYLVSNVLPDGLLGTQELKFHNDIPFVSLPYPGGSLHAVDVDEGMSPTHFASGYLAFEGLAPARQARIRGLNALQVMDRVTLRRTRLTDLVSGDPAAVHAVVLKNQTTGRSYLFVNEEMTSHVIGLPEEESDALLDELFSAFYEHTWHRGDIVIWDNLAIQHARPAISMPGHRTLQRVTIARYGLYDQTPSLLTDFDQMRTSNRGASWEKVEVNS
jgi:taurine dioxygenase